ncbi:MAG: hypothetical protein CXT73_04685 [Methanobacteriota archaeon]|nr:MAG: hypothetical protein CXT73_04685 [Euryarchaeota archaeon]
MSFIELVKAFIPTIIGAITTVYVWKICDFYEKKQNYPKPYLKILSGFGIYALFLAMHLYSIRQSEKAAKRLLHMKRSRKY